MSDFLLSERIEALSASPTLAMLAQTQQLKKQGVDVISLSVGEPDFDTPDNIKQAAKHAIDANYTHYSQTPGFIALREAVAAKLQRENNLTYAPEQIVTSNGGKQAIAQTLLALINPGDEVIIPAPYWVSYPEMVRLAEGKAVIVHTDMQQGFKITPEQLQAAITPATRALILCSPSNPTGAVYSRSELEALANVIRRHPALFVLSDEIYEHINYVGPHCSIAQLPDMQERTAILNGCSKGYAMTGWRLGWLAAPLWLAKAVSKLQGQLTSGPCSITQMAAIEAYNGPQDSVRRMREAFRRRRDLIYALVNDTPGLQADIPQGAFYIFPRCSDLFGKHYSGGIIANADDLAMFFLNEAHVAAVAGSGFGAHDYIRFSYANSEENITEAFQRIRQAINKLS